jgi:FtsZ-binding cell division protein ZapB
MDTITREDHEKIVNGLQADLDTFKKQLETATTTIETLEPLKVELEELKPKYATLEQFKNEADEAKQKQEKLDGIRQKLNDAKITVDDDFMNEKEEILLEMTEASLDFFIQELVAFSRKAVSNADAEASINLTSDLPGIDSSDDPGNGRVSTRDAVEFLRETFDK